MTTENDTVTISFSGEEFRKLEAKAKEEGVPVEEYLARMMDGKQTPRPAGRNGKNRKIH